MQKHALVPLLAYVALIAVWTGCGGEPFKMAPVSGKVAYADGSLIPGDPIMITFHPENAIVVGKQVAGAARGEVSPRDGAYSLTSHKADDGAAPGKYKVSLVATKMVGGVPTVTAAVAAKYQAEATTPLKFEVTGPTKKADFLNIEKPAKK